MDTYECVKAGCQAAGVSNECVKVKDCPLIKESKKVAEDD